MFLKSSAFAEGQAIPTQFTCDGEDHSPPLTWGDTPDKTASLALICDDPDAPGKVWVHWVIFNIAPNANSLSTGLPSNETLSNGAAQGSNDFRRTGYGGPCPPRGKAHRYFFKLYALDTKLDLRPGCTKDVLLNALKNHVLAEAQLMGTYQRK
jgi:hypothetical protein